MMTITNEEIEEFRSERLRNSTEESASEFSNLRKDSTKSSNEDNWREIQRSSSDRIKKFSESLKTPSNDGRDTPDSGSPVYKSTTESIHSRMDGECCYRLWRSWYSFQELVSKFTARQWKILSIICFATLTSSLSVCLFPPFFPKLAESKGHSASVYGMVIGTNCLTAFIVTPFIGKNMERIGVNFAFIAGMVGSGFCCFLSGFLEYFPNGYKFVVLAVLIRIVHATSNACVITSTIAFVACEFPTSVAFLFSITRATMNLAQMFGPALGGILHAYGGFKLPFFVLGGFQIFVSIICFWLLPSFKGKPKDQSKTAQKKNIWNVLRIPGLWIAFLTFVFSTMSNGFLSITLEPRVLRKFDLSPLLVGLVFGLKDGANCLASPIWGWMCDRLSCLKMFIVISSVLAAGSFILLGPFPGLPLEHTMGIVIFSLFLNGFGIGGQQVAGVMSAIKDAINEGYPDEADTHAFIAGLWSSLSGGGRFISRAGSGVLVDHIGFQKTSAIVTCLHFTIIAVTAVYICFSQNSKKSNMKRQGFQIHVDTNSPSEPLGSKSPAVAIPVMREDLEGSFLIGSTSSRVSKW